jgi:hypothetical protein
MKDHVIFRSRHGHKFFGLNLLYSVPYKLVYKTASYKQF